MRDLRVFGVESRSQQLGRAMQALKPTLVELCAGFAIVLATACSRDSDVPLAGGWVEIVRVELRVSVGNVRLPEHVVVANPRVRLVAP